MANNKTDRVNTSPLSMRDGKAYLDGELVADCCKYKVIFKPQVWSGKQLGSKATNHRWLGYDIELQMEAWKTTRRYRAAVDAYRKTGKTPEFTFQGIQEDKNSDFYDLNGKEKVTCVGCVPSGDIVLIDCDTDGEVVKENITFAVHDLV